MQLQTEQLEKVMKMKITIIRFQFVGIENIHVMRSSLQKLLEGKNITHILDIFVQ
jgi:hypothetical protein